KEDLAEGLKRHLVFFNTDPNIGSVIHGAAIAMEEKRAAGADITGESINAVKTGLMGPLAGIGDTLIQGIIIPLMVAIGISFGVTGNVFGSLFVLIGLPIVLIAIAYNSWMSGYRLGSDAVTNLLSGGKMKRMIGAAGILGCTVMGGLISQFVSFKTKITFAVGQQAFDLQAQFFDAIMPNLLPLAATLLVFWLLKKKVKSWKILVGLAIVGFVGGWIGIF
ncbi:MAG: PTS system mannose/fructose/sorbose family transporter subunit IID, partial [Synergistaceae bacterium]|nr:PTS system mannose/fructose/sorbose family transporter subunit IID [Synergistaceae bacterium]